jgi:hypothetical protein
MLCASLFLGENSWKGNVLLYKEIFCCKYSFFKKTFEKNHKLIFQENITTIIITSDYNFEETFENMSPE